MAYSFQDLATDVLKQADQPLTYQEVWDLGEDLGLAQRVKTRGKTPWQTLGARLYVEVRDDPSSDFMTVGKNPKRFWLVSRQSELPATPGNVLPTPKPTKPKSGAGYLESQLHPLLAYHCYASPAFNRGRAVHTKTINHHKSQKTGYNQWLHPDMVGFYLPLEDWDNDVVDLNRLSDNNSLRLFSFEIKCFLDQNNYREAFFQTVSNSSWAHEGYLVAARIDEDDELMSELDRLASAFGIGILHMDPANFEDAMVIHPARVRTELDWETINKLCGQNTDFRRFLEDVKTDFEAKRIHKTEYDSIISDPDVYTKETLGL